MWDFSPSAIAGGMLRYSRIVRSLRLPPDIGDGIDDRPGALVPSGMVTGWHLWPGFWAGPGYGRIQATLSGVYGRAFRAFDYDWRLSNRRTAAILAARVEDWLSRWRAESRNPEARAVFVCHSMGGLVARYFAEVLGGHEVTRRIVTIGTPYSGSINAVRALTGDAFTGFGRWGAELVAAARSFPSLYQLLPSYRCVQGVDGPFGLADADVPGLDSAFVADALRFHDQIAGAARRNGRTDYALNVFGGKRQGTLQSIRKDSSGIVYLQSQRGTDYYGDGTVPAFSAVPSEWEDTSQAEFHAYRHGGLVGAKTLLDMLLDKLRPASLGEILAPSCEIGVTVPPTASAGIPVTIAATTGDELALLMASAHDPATGLRIAESRMRPIGGTYEAHLDLPLGVWRIEVAAVAENPVVRVDDLIVVHP